METSGCGHDRRATTPRAELWEGNRIWVGVGRLGSAGRCCKYAKMTPFVWLVVKHRKRLRLGTGGGLMHTVIGL